MLYGPEHLEELKREHKKAHDIAESKFRDDPVIKLASFAILACQTPEEARLMLSKIWSIGYTQGAADAIKGINAFLSRHPNGNA